MVVVLVGWLFFIRDSGIPLNDDTLAVDVIDEIGPFGDFLSHPHTFNGMRSQSRPEIIDRRGRGMWESDGATDSYTRALNKVKTIIETHEPEPLSDEVLTKIRTIVQETEAKLSD